jgi:hypothetical protein
MENQEYALPQEEKLVLKESISEIKELKEKYESLDLIVYLEETDFSELSSEELDTDYDLLFDMHQKLSKIYTRISDLPTYRNRPAYPTSVKSIEKIMSGMVKALDTILETSVKRTYERGFI